MHEAEEIQEIISSIKKTFYESRRMDSSTIELIRNHLGRLQEYLTCLDNTQDLSSVVSDFIGSTSNLLGLHDNHLQNKLTLKSSIMRLEEEFFKFRQNFDCYRQMLFVPGLSLHQNDHGN